MKSLLLLLTLVPSIAFAGLEFSPSVSTFKADSEETTTQVELRLGYAFDFGLFVGGFYSLASDRFLEHSTQYYLGPMIGYEYAGAYALASYLLTGEQDLASGGTKYSGVSGFQASVGYRLPITEGVYVGPEFTLRSVDFENIETQGLASPTSRKDTHILPSITFHFEF